jgi:hypothetical protein
VRVRRRGERRAYPNGVSSAANDGGSMGRTGWIVSASSLGKGRRNRIPRGTSSSNVLKRSHLATVVG